MPNSIAICQIKSTISDCFMDRRSFLRLGREPQDNFELAEGSGGIVEAKRPELVLPRRSFVRGGAAAVMAGAMLGGDAQGAEPPETQFVSKTDSGAAELRERMAKMRVTNADRKLFYWVDDDEEVKKRMIRANEMYKDLTPDLLEEYGFLKKDEQFNDRSREEFIKAVLARFVEEDDWNKQILSNQEAWEKEKHPVFDKGRESRLAEYAALNDVNGYKLIVPSMVDCSPEMKEKYEKFDELGHTVPGTAYTMTVMQFEKESDGTKTPYFLTSRSPCTGYRKKGDYWNPHGFSISDQFSKNNSWDSVVNLSQKRLDAFVRGLNRVAKAK